MKTLGIHDKEAVDAMLARVISECKTQNVDQAYDDMLDECFSFKSVGGIFSSMSPSRVLAECDPTAYRCGMNDWLDGERDNILEIRSDYYRADDVATAQEEFVDGLKDELSTMQNELEELRAETEPDAFQFSIAGKNEIAKLEDEIARKESAIEACEDHAW